jgi:membrane-bound lytic murein transglycosylase D
MTKRLPFAAGLAGTALLALLTAPVLAQEVPEPTIGRPASPQVGSLLMPADTSVATLPGVVGDSTVPAPASFVGPLLPVLTPQPAQVAAAAVDSTVIKRTQRIAERLRGLEKEVPLVFNPYVRGYIDYFTIRNPKYTRRMLERQHLYFSLFERKLAQYGMPIELKYLSVVESALNTKAASHAKAVGLWQFIPQAATDYRLVINSWKDERMDPEKATDAACRYLRNLNRAFGGDWELALAAYNCGPGNVRKAIKRAGGRANFWAIFPYLPQETRGYVPSFTAVVYAMTYASEYGIVAEDVKLPVTTDTVMVNGPLDIAKLSETLGLDSKTVHDLNPELRRPLLPLTATGYSLKIPADKRLAFDAVGRAALLASCQPAPAATVALVQDSANAANRPNLKASRYVVHRGETLQRVAWKNGCSVAQLRAWNKLRSRSVVKAGQGLIVWHAVKPKPVQVDDISTIAARKAGTDTTGNRLAASSAAPAAAATTTEVATTATSAPQAQTPAAQAVINASTAPVAAVAALSADQLDSARANGYTVQRGDNLFQIARVFGVSVKKVTEWNGLSNQQIQLGQTLVMRAPAAEQGVAEAEPATATNVLQPGGELAGDTYVAAPRDRTARASAATAARNRWTANARQRVRATHLVQPGDTLWDISRKRNVSVEQIRRLNGLKSDALKPGQRIVLS